ncbi:S-adenosyl-L-methionine-dependent methyltransferase [Endogone sp. FLAS-F59071]|nr:S-adenosyl-L-methionine-dependent methyltransferase [Endogone sp. FLAS-F59071]|eukprot:RUS20236.1 S-adenosyl-L-methionine-dependent methyltransferase [Endogone sp. FLAS-F59071]
MVARARELNPPEMHFVQGSMLEIGVADKRLAGIVSFYAVIHVERGLVPVVLQEFYRVLKKDGTVLVAVHGGEGESRFEEAFGVKVPYTATLFNADELRGYFEDAGFEKVEVMEREPLDFEMQTKRIYVFATK